MKEANKNEPLLPWGRYHQGRVVLGSRVEAACATPADLQHAATLYKQEKFVICYRADKKKVRHARSAAYDVLSWAQLLDCAVVAMPQCDSNVWNWSATVVLCKFMLPLHVEHLLTVYITHSGQLLSCR